MTEYQIDGRAVLMPVVVRDASAGTAMFEVDAAAAQKLVPGTAFTVVESSPGRSQVAIATIDYRDNDLGEYHEVGITLFVTPADGDGEAGTFITRLPVDERFTCAAGKGIWGFPKTVEDIVMEYRDDEVATTLRMDGQLVFRLTLPRGGSDEMPQMPMTAYTYIDGAPHATAFSQGGSGSQVVVGGEGVELELGVHPVSDELAALGLGAEPAVLSTWTESMQGTFDAPTSLA
jgi:hypothetical protein